MPSTDPARGERGRFARTYTGLAVAFLSTVLVLAVINAVLYAFPSLRTSLAMDTPIATFGVDRLRPAYPGWSVEEITRLHAESRVVFEYEPIVEFKIRPMSGSYVNTSSRGFRLNANQGPWPPSRDNLNVFVFGGSPTFGWLLPDRGTIVSQMQDLAAAASCRRRIVIYNFGQPSYISTQEALFFQSLVTAGTVPDLAVFVDGFNDFFYQGRMAFSNTFRQVMDRTDRQYRLGPLIDLPMYQLAKKLRADLLYRLPNVDAKAEERTSRNVIQQWVRNRTFIDGVARQHGVATAFVWQPVAAYQYDLRHHFIYSQEQYKAGERVPYDDIGRAYVLMDGMRGELDMPQHFLWLADMQKDKRENLYVDRVHYTAEFSAEIAGRILAFLKDEKLLDCTVQAP